MTHHVNWIQLEYLVNKIVENIPQGVSNVYGIPRGGLVAAVMISHITGLPFSDSISESTLIVDDIYDTGETMEPYLKEGYHCATLFSKHNVDNLIVGKYLLHDDNWVVFPWENKQLIGNNIDVRI